MDQRRIERLTKEVERLQVRWAEIRIARPRTEVAMLRGQLAEVQPLHRAQAAILEYLATQTGPTNEDRIHEAVETRRVILLKALRSLVQDGKVIRTGTGKKGDPYLYRNAGTPVPISMGYHKTAPPPK